MAEGGIDSLPSSCLDSAEYMSPGPEALGQRQLNWWYFVLRVMLTLLCMMVGCGLLAEHKDHWKLQNNTEVLQFKMKQMVKRTLKSELDTPGTHLRSVRTPSFGSGSIMVMEKAQKVKYR